MTQKALFKTLIACTLLSFLAACNTKDTTQDNTSTNSSGSSPSTASSPSAASSPGSLKATASSKATATKINVTEKEMAIQVSSATAPAGPVEFIVKNEGKMPHEFVVLKTELSDKQLPLKGDNLDEEAKGLKNLGEIGEDQLKSGATQNLKINLTPGRYLLVCNLPGHFKAGMKTAFTVK